MSARPSPVVSASRRGWRSTRQPPASARVSEVRDQPLESAERSVGLGERRCRARRHRSRRCPPGHHPSYRRASRGWRSTRQPCWVPKLATTNCTGPNDPSACATDAVHPGVTEAHDVRPAITRRIRQQPRMASPPANPRRCKRNWPRRAPPDRTSHPACATDRYTPASPKPTMSARPSPVVSARNRGCRSTRQPCCGTEVRDDELHRTERAVRLRARPVHPGVTEAHDVRPAITRRIRQQPRVALHPPTPGAISEIGHHELAPDRTTHPACATDRYTPASPKPTMSARPSPVVSASSRGCLSTRQPPAT